MAAMSGFRGSHSVTRTNFFCPVLRPRQGRLINLSRFCRAGPLLVVMTDFLVVFVAFLVGGVLFLVVVTFLVVVWVVVIVTLLVVVLVVIVLPFMVVVLVVVDAY